MKHFTDLQFNKQALVEKLSKFSPDQQQRIQQAIALAEQYHDGQVRNAEKPTNMPYVIHCIRTALWLIEQKIIDADIIIAMILHDTLEDTPLAPGSIESKFGKRVLGLVQSVTRERPDNETEEDKIKSKTTQFEKLARDPTETRFMKTADFLDNMRSWPLIPKNGPMAFKIPRWINEAEKYYIPITNTVAPQAVPEMETIVQKVKEKFL